MTPRDARRYLTRLRIEHGGALAFVVGMLLLVAGLSVGAVGLLGGFVVFAGAMVSASVSALRSRRDGQPMFGPSSTAAEINRLTGWWYLDEASEVLRLDARQVRSQLRACVWATGVAFVAIVPVAVVAAG